MLSFCISLGSKDNKIYLLCYIFINIFTYRDKICRELTICMLLTVLSLLCFFFNINCDMESTNITKSNAEHR